MIGCRLLGTVLVSFAVVGVGFGVDDRFLASKGSAAIAAMQSAIDPASSLFGTYGAVPLLDAQGLVAKVSHLAVRIPIIAFALPLTLGLLLLLSRSWHSNDFGRPKLDGIGLFGLGFLVAWNIVAIAFIVVAISTYLQGLGVDQRFDLYSIPLWDSIPLWCRSLGCFLTAFVGLVALSLAGRRRYVGVYWIVASALLTITDNVLTVIISGLAGADTIACAIACWPSVTSAAVWWYFLKSNRALEYFD